MNVHITEGNLHEAALDAAEEAAEDMARLGRPMSAKQAIEMVRTVTKQVAMQLVGLSSAQADATVAPQVAGTPAKAAPRPKTGRVAAARKPEAAKPAKAKKDTRVRVRNIALEKGRVYLRGMKFGAPATNQAPAVEPKFSVYNDYIVCLEDGQRYKMLKRPLMTRYRMTPEQYRAKWGLPEEYPLTAPSHSNIKREEARAVGLGHRTAEFRAARQGAPIAAEKVDA